jgi:alginate O-acetyltransferase complex protein AlgI
MLFTQIEFIIFFLAIFAFLLLVKNFRAQKILLLIASYYFYAYWDWRFLGLIIISTVIDYFAGLGMKNSKNQKTRRIFLTCSLIANLGLLGTFKYFNFFISSFSPIVASLGFEISSLNIILPIGISFYTFQTMSYSIDVYFRKIEACPDFADFALFVAFFPQLVAGPIVRASDFLPQLKTARKITLLNIFFGFRQFVYGLFKKVFIADNLSIFVDPIFSNPGAFSCLTTWMAVIAYALQIYCDFSGYSDMAIGLARTMGYKFPKNFNLPYISQNISEFWSRWHISLSSWLRDYLYIPLGGNRKGKMRTYLNLMITMLLGGLWHGAAWTFVFWGCLHGVALAIEKVFISFNPSSGENYGITKKILNWGLTFLFVLITWVFFRSRTFTSAVLTLRQMFVPSQGIIWYHPFVIGAILIMAFLHIINAAGKKKILVLKYPYLKTPVTLFTIIFLIIIFRPKGFNPFIYFQF